MPNFTQEYRNTDAGMPTCTGVAGSLTALLDAVLVSGGTPQAVISMSQTGTTVTALIPADTSLENLDWLVIAGATPAGANGTVQIAFIDSTHFSYQAAAGLGTITGSITYKRAPLGWGRVAGAAGVVAYQAAAGIANCPQFWLRVDDSDTLLTTGRAREACVRGYETMTDANTGTGPFPTVAQAANGLCWRKSSTLDATARGWFLIGDGATFYLIVNSDTAASSGRQFNGFGAFTSFKPGDAYNALISGTTTFNSATASGTAVGLGRCSAFYSTSMTLGAGLLLARPVSQVAGAAGAVLTHKWIDSATSPSGTLGGQLCVCNYPSSADGALWMDSPMLFETNTLPRGRPRGLYTHCHTTNPFTSDFDVTSNNVIAGLPGVTLISALIATNNPGSAQFDRYGPW